MTTMFSALMIVLIAINTVPSVYSDYFCCPKCPTCSAGSIDQVSESQQQQIISQRSVIEEIKQDPQLLYNSSYQRSFVTLTSEQNRQILANYPDLFRDRESFQNSTVGTVSQTPTGGGRARRSASTQVCPPVFGSAPLIIARTAPRGDVVELVQMPEQGLNQWILEETCKYQQDPGLTNLDCCLVERHVAGLFINLSRKSQELSGNDFDFADIIVQSCASFKQ